jgi:hypothetical protein
MVNEKNSVGAGHSRFKVNRPLPALPFFAKSGEAGLAETHIPSHHSRMEPVTERLRNFLQYVALKLIDDPKQAQLKVAELGPKKLRFKLVLAQADVAMLIGRNGFTASAIRSVLKAAAEREGVQVSLQIHSHEEEAALLARNEGH